MPGSSQGEHVFNALGDLVREFVDLLTKNINPKASQVSITSAHNAINLLNQNAATFIRERNNSDFRTGPNGDVTNIDRYSNLAQTTRQAIKNILSGNPSLHTRGYTDLNKLLDNLDYYAIDTRAKDTARAALNPHRQDQFDIWFRNTQTLMQTVFENLIAAALAVYKTNVS